jgi:hypothetical protein
MNDLILENLLRERDSLKTLKESLEREIEEKGNLKSSSRYSKDRQFKFDRDQRGKTDAPSYTVYRDQWWPLSDKGSASWKICGSVSSQDWTYFREWYSNLSSDSSPRRERKTHKTFKEAIERFSS